MNQEILALKILVVEDCDDTCEVFKILLEDLIPGVKISIANDPVSAMRALDEQTYDLVIVDYGLSHRLTGADVIKHIRDNPTWNQTVVILVSAYDNDILQKVRGADAVLNKPYEPHQLARVVQQFKPVAPAA